MTRRGAILLACLLAAPPLLVGLGGLPLVDPDEGRYAWAAREMARDGLSITPEYNGEPRFAKPAPLTWLQALSLRALGETEAALRLPCALLALGAVAVVSAAGADAAGPGAGLVAGLVLGTSLRFVAVGRQALVDAPLVLAMTGTLASLLAMVTAASAGERARALARAHVWMAVGALAKGPVALVIPWLAILVHAASARSLASLRGARVLRALAIFLAIALPYYLAMLARHGGTWLEEVLVRQHVKRALGVGFGQPSERGWDYFLRVAPGDLMPWTPVVLAALVLVAIRFRALEVPIRERCRLLLAWSFVVIAFFSFPAFKLPHYVLPAYPALALVAGLASTAGISGIAEGGLAAPRWVAGLATGTSAILLAASAGLVWAYVAALGGDARVLLAGAVAAGIAGTALVALRPRAVRAALVLGVLASFLETAISGIAIPSLASRFRPERALAGAVPVGVPVGVYGTLSSAFVYYVGRRVELLGSEEELVGFLTARGPAVVLTSWPPRDELRRRIRREVARGTTIAPRLADLFAPRAPGELVLVEAAPAEVSPAAASPAGGSR